MATTKQDVADYINAQDTNKVFTGPEWGYVQSKLDPYLAYCMIKLVGDVSWLVEVRDNMSQSNTNRDMFE
jgi:hypothetical protein|tara:strand:- start:344 stop:553 length:210 start_codon:yes stop_codon:yes gene_type:complete